MTAPFHFHQGTQPLLISIPHCGIVIPDDISANMTEFAALKKDTDWHLIALYNMAKSLGASIISATHSRYVIDLNRPPEDTNLYPGQDTTSLCPVDTFDKQPLYRAGLAPNAEQIKARISQYWQPYHQQLSSELARIKAQYGVAVLWDAHSIASVVPRFFEGKLPDLNFGTVNGQSCDASLQNALQNRLTSSANSSPFSHVFNGRFKGGYITRHYGQPAQHIHAIQ